MLTAVSRPNDAQASRTRYEAVAMLLIALPQSERAPKRHAA
ncbi:MAG: hypothetical protein AVDCRST_MAG42-671 [uncultured Chthoniobacterales bacterium]|uniref:Uncharacterized protein n=1 Tax=uncultured Chthoniobacterales bacterium TaxID=1836801 RepID=A0A6J4HF68_9BACT|nr:MAG: hypothetical protein AVDCRST_MAG42-671 [uncultured Chthoniobacterales bacterium]